MLLSYCGVYRSVLLDLLRSRVQVKHDKQEGANDSRESSKVIGVGREQKSLELVMLVRAYGHPFRLLNEHVSRLLVVYLELVDAFFLRRLSHPKST